jgi:predicted glycoside hydrolase/deacetylase ChbG (UPF0249 family)
LTARKRLVINADDFGFTPDVNEGIVECWRRGVLTATTMMANGAAFEHALGLAREAPGLDIGVHFVLIGGRSLATGKELPATVSQLLAAMARREIPIEAELRAQLTRILESGLRPSHLDTHKHTHLAPPVLGAVARLSREFGIPWVRRPFDFPLNALRVPPAKRLVSRALGVLRGQFHRKLEKHGCRTTDHFAGFQITGTFRTSELVDLLGVIPPGTTELMCHPGHCGEALRSARTRLKESREHELQALVSAEVREAVERNGIELVTFRDLSEA